MIDELLKKYSAPVMEATINKEILNKLKNEPGRITIMLEKLDSDMYRTFMGRKLTVAYDLENNNTLICIDGMVACKMKPILQELKVAMLLSYSSYKEGDNLKEIVDTVKKFVLEHTPYNKDRYMEEYFAGMHLPKEV